MWLFLPYKIKHKFIILNNQNTLHSNYTKWFKSCYHIPCKPLLGCLTERIDDNTDTALCWVKSETTTVVLVWLSSPFQFSQSSSPQRFWWCLLQTKNKQTKNQCNPQWNTAKTIRQRFTWRGVSKMSISALWAFMDIRNINTMLWIPTASKQWTQLNVAVFLSFLLLFLLQVCVCYLWRACSGWSHCACHSCRRPGHETGTAHQGKQEKWQPPGQ